MLSIPDAFKVLNLSTDASMKDIRRAYRALVRSWHPDRFPNDPRLQQEAQDRLKEINAAYNIARKHVKQPASSIDSPFQFPAPFGAADGTAAAGFGKKAPSAPAPSAKPWQPASPSPIERPVVLNIMFLFLATAVIWLSWQHYGMSAQSLVHVFLILTIPALCALICNSPLGISRQLRAGYFVAILIAGGIILFDELTLRRHSSDTAVTIPADGETPSRGGHAPTASGFGGIYTLDSDERSRQKGPLSPSSPLSPSVPQAAPPASPTPPRAPLGR